MEYVVHKVEKGSFAFSSMSGIRARKRISRHYEEGTTAVVEMGLEDLIFPSLVLSPHPHLAAVPGDQDAGWTFLQISPTTRLTSWCSRTLRVP